MPALQLNLPKALARLAALHGETPSPHSRASAIASARFEGSATTPDDSTLPAPVAQVLRAHHRYRANALTKR